MTTTDYIISAALILLVVPQIRGTRQTLLHTLLPLAAVAAAAAYYLKSFPTQGHDIRLDAVTVAAGAAPGRRRRRGPPRGAGGAGGGRGPGAGGGPAQKG
ncbi:hypothetical protein ACFW9X_37900, partial [Streptomyces sp. NPDC059466]